MSICIPIYNFGQFIADTLDSIIAQQVDQAIEIVVVDGASTDSTESVVRPYADRDERITYHRLPRKGGIDFDMAESVRLAKGEYCWLFSGDDIMRPGSISRILSVIRDNSDIILCKHSNCDKSMVFANVHPVFLQEQPFITNLAIPELRKAYFENCFNTEGLFSFMSGLVIKRSTWLSVPDPDLFMKSCWAHAARAFLLATSHSSLLVQFVPEVLLDKRGENDSFLDKGIVHRIKIAVDGYASIVDHYFGHDSAESRQVPRILLNETNVITWLSAKHKAYINPEQENLADLIRMNAFCLTASKFRLLNLLVFRTATRPLLKIAAHLLALLRSTRRNS